MLLAYVGLNVGVLAVTTALDTATVGAGLGLGLFGVLSIIRLRSTELTQEEVAYYFVSLAMGLLVGRPRCDPAWTSPSLIGVMVAVMFVVDHPRLFTRYRHQIITLDAAYTDERELKERLETLLCAEVKQIDLGPPRPRAGHHAGRRALPTARPRQPRDHRSAFEPQELLGVSRRA